MERQAQPTSPDRSPAAVDEILEELAIRDRSDEVQEPAPPDVDQDLRLVRDRGPDLSVAAGTDVLTPHEALDDIAVAFGHELPADDDDYDR